jgi:(5-formylfuran-3-yl)methyl phosphate synthase
MIKLSVSVQNLAEAKIAIEAGVDMLDIKAPAFGPLGRLPYAEIAQILAQYGDTIATSVALGEVYDWKQLRDEIEYVGLWHSKVHYVKWGMSQCINYTGVAQHAMLHGINSKSFAVVYADGHRCRAADVRTLEDIFPQWQPAGILVDTFHKDGKNLLDYYSVDGLQNLRKKRVFRNTPFAVAGSVRWEDMEKIKQLQPDWLAVRGLVCQDGNRKLGLELERILKLKEMLKS